MSERNYKAELVGVFGCPVAENPTIVCDVIPNPPRTLFLAEAKKRGAKTLDGLGMLVNQGAIGFKLWTGVEAPVEVMKKALSREFGISD